MPYDLYRRIFTDETVSNDNIRKFPDGTFDDFLFVPSSPDWTWAGAPFITPPIIALVGETLLQIGLNSVGAERAFLFKSGSVSSIQARVGLSTLNSTHAVGLRYDDGTDNNYVEYKWRMSTGSPGTYHPRASMRTDGGSITNVDGPTVMYQNDMVIKLSLEGTLYSNWSFRALIRPPGTIGSCWLAVGGSGLTWTPTRRGLIFQDEGSNSTFEKYMVDWIKFQL